MNFEYQYKELNYAFHYLGSCILSSCYAQKFSLGMLPYLKYQILNTKKCFLWMKGIVLVMVYRTWYLKSGNMPT